MFHERGGFFFSSKSRNQSQTNFNGRLTKKKKERKKIQIIDRAENTQKSRLVGGDLLPSRSKGEK